MAKKIINTSKGLNVSSKQDIKQSDSKEITLTKSDFAFDKINYYIMFVGLAFIIIGFILMIGGGSDDPNVFKEDEIYSFRRITLAPIIVLIGYVIEIIAILYKPKD